MFASIKYRMLAIAAMVIICVVSLFPREQTIRERGPDGVMRDVTVTRVPLKLGLDLQGGMHLQLALDTARQASADPERDIQLALTVLRKRIDEFGVTEPLVQQQGKDRIVVELAGVTDPNRAKAIVQRSAFLEFRILDETGALEKALPAMDRALRRAGVRAEAGAPQAPSAVEELLQGDSGRKADTATAELTGGVLSSLIETAADAGFGLVPGEYLVKETAFPRVDSLLALPEVQAAFPRNLVYRWSATTVSVGTQLYRPLYVLEDRPMVTGQSLVDAKEDIDQLTQGPIVRFELDRAGARRFGEGTARHIGDYMAIILDDRVQGRPPVIQSRIDRHGQITLSGKTFQEARDLALTLKAGALPVPLKIVEERQVGPSLGADAIRSGIIAGIIGTAFVILVMVSYYRMAGMLAVLALFLYVLFTLGGLSTLGATLTLPGLAGLVLSIGIAVDGNVLIFERIREELAAGKTVRLAADEGFRHAMSAIIDSNVTTILTGLFLFWFGTGPVQGFAVTLILGIIASMITAVFVTRTFFLIWLDRRPAMSTLSI